MNGNAINKSQLEKEIADLEKKLPELLQNCTEDELFNEISEALGLIEKKPSKTPSYLKSIPEDFLSTLNKETTKYKEELKECHHCLKHFSPSKFKDHLLSCKIVKKISKPKKSQSLFLESITATPNVPPAKSTESKKRKQQPTNGEEEEEKKIRRVKRVKPKIPIQGTPHQPNFQTKIQPNSNLSQLAIQPTRKLAKSPIKSSPNLTPTTVVTSPFQPIMQSIPQPKTPIYSTKAPLPTKQQIPLNQNSLNNPMRQNTSQPILMNTPNNYPMRSNPTINQPLHPHHNRQPNITQKFTLNPFSQVRKINYQGNHQINTSPLLYKNYHHPINQPNMFTTPQYPYQYVYPFSQIPTQNPYYMHQMKRVPFQTQSPQTINPTQLNNPNLQMNSNPPMNSQLNSSTNLLNITTNNSLNQSTIHENLNVDTSHYFNFPTSPPRKSK